MAEKKTKKREEEFPLVDPWSLLQFPLLTEKAIGKIETENKLVFIVNRQATKTQIRWAVERALSVKVDDIQTIIDRKGRKKAWVRLNKEFSASDIATRFGML